MEKYKFVITEKPSVASRIASALDNKGKPKRKLENGVPYYEAYREDKILVVPALGHLYTISAKEKGRFAYPSLDYEWVPLYKTQHNANQIRIFLQVIKRLSRNANVFIDACDYDLEGSIIGYCILKYACGSKEKVAKRMKYSTLTDEEINNSYTSLLPHLDFQLIESGLARHEIDWLYGINLSRALASAAKQYSSQYTALSTGRVQGPALMFLAEREKQIARFVPDCNWALKAKIKMRNSLLTFECKNGSFADKEKAEAIVERCRGKDAEVESIVTKNIVKSPPIPFDLGSLQLEAYRLFKYAPFQTSSVSQKLYMNALISYPRTNSQKLPKEIGYQKILKYISKNQVYTELVEDLLAKPILKPAEGEQKDPAHPAIYPTGNKPRRTLIGSEKNIYDLVVRRFMATFGEPSVHKKVTVTIAIGGEKFFLSSKRLLMNGWLSFYKPFLRTQDAQLPEFVEGETLQVQEISLEDQHTEPPSRYNPGSILKKLTYENIGTKATRASIIKTLYDRKYIHAEQIAVTNLGSEVNNILKEYCPTITSVEFSRYLEKKMDLIQQGRETKDNVISEAVASLKPILAILKENEMAIGKRLSQMILQ